MIIQSKNFILRPYRKGDENDVVKNINDRAVSRFLSIVPYPYSRKDAKFWINKCLKGRKEKKKTAVRFAIEMNGKVIGAIDLSNIQKHKAEIGYWLGRKYWNKGIISEAIRLITNFGFNKLKLKRIYATVFAGNRKSAGVLEKNGFKLEGLLIKDILKNGKLYDSHLYAKIK